ncbi:MAG: hypothetical protein ABSE99_16165 [Terracidiphilus sp.]|jgi:hypothetical protein
MNGADARAEKRFTPMAAWFTAEWPWYVAGPLIGAFVPALLITGNKLFGVSSNLRHLCSAIVPGRVEFLRYDWKKAGLWNLVFLGVCLSKAEILLKLG